MLEHVQYIQFRCIIFRTQLGYIALGVSQFIAKHLGYLDNLTTLDCLYSQKHFVSTVKSLPSLSLKIPEIKEMGLDPIDLFL